MLPWQGADLSVLANGLGFPGPFAFSDRGEIEGSFGAAVPFSQWKRELAHPALVSRRDAETHSLDGFEFKELTKPNGTTGHQLHEVVLSRKDGLSKALRAQISGYLLATPMNSSSYYYPICW